MLASLYLAAPDAWGWNPSSFQAIGSVAVLGSLAVALWAIIQTRGEVAVRTRPWVGLTGCDYFGDPGAPEGPIEGLNIHFHNVGLLPAHSLEIRDVRVGVAEEGSPAGVPGPVNDYFEMDKWPVGTVFPNEPSIEAIVFRGERAARAERWREEARKVHVLATFSYALGNKKYSTKFQVTLDFSEKGDDDKLPLIHWNNDAAT